MVNSNANAIGIIFPNSYDNLVPDLRGARCHFDKSVPHKKPSFVVFASRDIIP